MTKKVVVTGSKGFIGRNLVTELCKKGYEVVEIDIPEIDITKINMNDPEFIDLLKNSDTLFHLSVMNLENCKKDYYKCIETNITGTTTLMELARKVGIRRVIYSSASSIYGDPITTEVSESHPQMPITMYGVTKLAAEKIIHSYSKNFDLTYGIFRFTNVYGPGQVNGLIPTVINKLLRRQLISVTGTGLQTRDFIYVNDVIKILIEAINRPKYSFISNLGSGEKYSINYIIRLLSELTGISAYTQNIEMQIDRRTFRADLDMLNSLFGNIQLTPIEEGLFKTIKWWKERNINEQG